MDVVSEHRQGEALLTALMAALQEEWNLETFLRYPHTVLNQDHSHQHIGTVPQHYHAKAPRSTREDSPPAASLSKRESSVGEIIVIRNTSLGNTPATNSAHSRIVIV